MISQFAASGHRRPRRRIVVGAFAAPRLFRVFMAFLGAVLGTAAVAQTSVTLDATSGSSTILTTYSTTGGLTINLGFFAEYLAVGGGGSGGTPGGSGSAQDNWGTGGGGGGGFLTGTTTLGATSYDVTVGGGGAAPAYSSGTTSRGNNGANSVFASGTAFGGGGGGGGENSFGGVGANGGSGGGGGSKYSNAGGTATTGQGTAGGAARNGDLSTAGNRTAGGGGGGAGGVGGTPVTNSSNGGAGGAGLLSTITGVGVTYAGGGGGGAWDTFDSGETAGAGGSGGGGAGITSGTATAGTDDLGGGGGGSGVNGTGGRGGSGIVIVRYKGASLGEIGGTVTPGSGSAAGYTLHTFTTTGTTTATSALDLSGVDMNARLGTTLASVNALSGSGSFTFAGPGRLTLAQANYFTGDTLISSGTLAIGNADALQNSTLDMNASGSGSIIFSQNSNLGGLKGSRNFDNGGRTLTIGGNHADTTYSGQISGTGGLTKSGSGSLTLVGDNLYSGTTIVSSGTLAIGDGGTSGSVAGNIVNEFQSALVFDRSDAVTYAGVINGLGSLTKKGAGTLTLAGNSWSYVGLTTVLGGTLAIGAGSTSGTIAGPIANFGAVVFDRSDAVTYVQAISGSGSLTKRGAGTLTLRGSNSFTGDTRIAAGTLTIGNANTGGDSYALQYSTLDMNASDSGTISFAQNSFIGGLKGSRNVGTGGRTLTIGGNNTDTTYSGQLFGSGLAFDSGGLTKTGTGTLTLTGSNSFVGDTRISSGTLVIGNANALQYSKLDMNVNDSGAITFSQDSTIGGLKGSRNLDNGGRTLTLSLFNSGGNYSGQLSGSGGLIVDSATTTHANVLSGSNSFTGGTHIKQGRLMLGIDNALPVGSELKVDYGGLVLRKGYSLTVANAVINGGVGQTDVGSSSGFGGLFTVTGTLSGAGSFNGDVLVNGVHAPGNSPGYQIFAGNLTYGSGAVINWELTDNAALEYNDPNIPVPWDYIALVPELLTTPSLTFSGSNVLSLSFDGAGSLVDWTDSFWDTTRKWLVFDTNQNGPTVGFSNLSLGGSLLDSNGLALDASRGSFSLSKPDFFGTPTDDVFLVYTAVPEPSTYAMALAGLACAGYSVWRRRRRA